MIKYMGIAVLCAAATVFLRETKSPLARFIPLCGSLCILVYAAVSLRGSVSAIESLADGTVVSEYTGTLLRALGIGYTAELTADVCRGCGADSVSSAILTMGRVELAALACPLLLNLLSAASSVLF